MDEFVSVTLFIAAIFGILQIVLFFKIWGMTNDTKRMSNDISIIANNLVNTMHYMNNNQTSPKLVKKEIDACKEKYGVTYTIDGGYVCFSDGIFGEIKQYEKQCSFVTKDNYELLYLNSECACLALYEYLTTNKESLDGLVLKDKA